LLEEGINYAGTIRYCALKNKSIAMYLAAKNPQTPWHTIAGTVLAIAGIAVLLLV